MIGISKTLSTRSRNSCYRGHLTCDTMLIFSRRTIRPQYQRQGQHGIRKYANAFIGKHLSNSTSILVSTAALECISLPFPSSCCTTESPYHICSRYIHVFVKALCTVKRFFEENKLIDGKITTLKLS